jgi:integrase
MINGLRYNRAVGTESDGVTREQAEQYLEQLKTDARHDRLDLPVKVVEAKPLTFKEAADEYLNRIEQEGSAKDVPTKEQKLEMYIVPFFGQMLITEITTFDVERYKKQRLSEFSIRGGDKLGTTKKGGKSVPVQPATVNRSLNVLSHIFSKAIEWGWIDKRPAIKLLKLENQRITYLSAEQISRLLNVAKQDINPDIYPFIVIGLEAGMRKAEILRIRVEHIDLLKRKIYIHQAKVGAREQPITENITHLLAQRLQNAANQEWLFPSETSKTGHVISIEKPFRRVVLAAGLDPKVVLRHTLRHTCITHLVQAGVDLPTVQRISGHKTMAMVLRYTHQDDQHLQEAMDKLEQRYKGDDSKAS